MGLSQSFVFAHDGREEIEQFLKRFLKSMRTYRKGELFVITEHNGKKVEFELGVEHYGLYVHRSGDCFELLGCLVDALTGEFGRIEVDDV